MRLFVLTVVTCSIMGCAQYPISSKEPMRNDDKAYLQATTLPSLIVPDDLKDKTRFAPLYPIPSGALPEAGSKAISPKPPGMGEVIVEEIEVIEVNQ